MEGIGRTLLYALLVVTVVFALLFFVALLSPRPISADALRYFSRDYIEQARRYTFGSYLIYAIRIFLQLGFYALIIWGPLGPALLRLSRRWGGDRYYLVLACLTVLIVVALRLVMLPFSFYRSYIYEHQWHLSNTSLGLYISDYLKGFVIELLFTVPGIWILYALIRRTPSRWWIWVAVGYALWNVVSVMLGPIVIDPLFYKFTPVENPELRQRIVTLADRAGLQVDEVLVMDASRRTKKVNAYYTGFGHTKRIVLYDNLVNNYSLDEIELVVAHELGHWKHQHVNQGLLLGAVGGFLLFWVAASILRSFVGRGPLYLSSQADPAGLPVVLLVLFLLMFVSMPLQNTISRYWERQADATAFQLTNKAEVWVGLEQRLVTQNMSDVEPHPFTEFLLYTHPPVLDRIRAAETYAQQHQ